MNYQKKILLLVISLHFFCQTFCQADTLPISNEFQTKPDHKFSKEYPLFDKVWAPIGLSLLSVSFMTDSSKYGLQTLIRQPFNDYETAVDDYIQYIPIAIMYTTDLFKVKSKNTPWNQTKFLAMSELGTAFIVQLLKYTLRVERPDKTSRNSYPSGHTAQAFVASQVLYNEYRETNKLIAYSGYLFSVSTGALRIVNNRHWVPDVLLGAGIAMLVTNLVYYYEPLKEWNPFFSKKRKADIGFFPFFREDYIGTYLTLKF